MLRIGSVGPKQALLTGGFAEDFAFGGDGTPNVLPELAGHAVYALLVPENAQQFSISAIKPGAVLDVEFAASVDSLNDGAVLYVREPGLTVTVNQQTAPNDLSFGGRYWELLGTINVVPDNTTPQSPAIEVFIRQAIGGVVTADAVMIRKVEPVLPELRLLTLMNNPLNNRDHDLFIPTIEARASTLGLAAPDEGPANGELINDLQLGLAIVRNAGQQTKLEISLFAEDTLVNDSLSDLVAQIQPLISNALVSAGLPSTSLTLVLQGDRLAFNINNTSIASLRVQGGAGLGFANDQGVGPDVEFVPNQAPLIAPIPNQDGTPTVVSFNGISSVRVGSGATLALSGQFTLEAWINPTGAGNGPQGSGGIIINREGEYELARFADGTIRWAFANVSPGWNWINTNYVAPLNQWTHIAVTYSNGAVKTYANGELVHFFQGAGVITDIDPASNEVWIGERQAPSIQQGFQGQIDEVRVWNRARLQPELRRDVNRTLVGNESGLVGYWTFDDHGAALADDRSVNNNVGTLFGATRLLGPVRIDVTDTLGDPLYLSAFSDDPGIQVTIQGTSLIITPGQTFQGGTPLITVTAMDGLGAANDPRGRSDTTRFHVAFDHQAISVEVTLYYHNEGLIDVEVAKTVTDAAGRYTFPNLAPLDYFLQFTPPAGFDIQPTPYVNPGDGRSSILVSLSPGQSVNYPTVVMTPTITTPPFRFDQSFYLVDEGTRTVQLTILRNPTVLTPSVLLTIGGTATRGSDYLGPAARSLVTFAPGQTSKSVTIQILGDALSEGNETLLLGLSLPNGAPIPGPRASTTLSILERLKLSDAGQGVRFFDDLYVFDGDLVVEASVAITSEANDAADAPVALDPPADQTTNAPSATPVPSALVPQSKTALDTIRGARPEVRLSTVEPLTLISTSGWTDLQSDWRIDEITHRKYSPKPVQRSARISP
jgi:hypothetical protein